MKKYVLSLMLLFVALGAQAASRLYFDELKIKPGETKAVELLLQNEDQVKGLELVVTLSEGLSFVEDDEEEEYAVGTDRCVFIASQLKANGSLGIAGVATKKKDYIAAGDGAIATLLVKAADDLPPGEASVTISRVEMVFVSNPVENPEAETFAIKVYETFTVTVASADEAMGTVTASATEVEAGEAVTVTATPATGYHFAGWSDEATENPYTFTVTANVELTAQWMANTYYVIYMVNGEEWARDAVAYGDPIVLREYTPDDGYKFGGWQCDDEYTTMPAHDVVYTADITTGIMRLLGDERTANIHDMTGRLLYRNMPTDGLRRLLPAGVYIVDGKKMIVN